MSLSDLTVLRALTLTKTESQFAPSVTRKALRLPALDALRGLAAVAVVFHHFYLSLPPPLQQTAGGLLNWPGLRLIVIGRSSVILFFVLSGFVLTRSMRLDPNASVALFVARRCLRIYPPFLAAIAISAVLFALVAPAQPTILSAWFNAQWSGALSNDIVVRHILSQAVAKDTTLDHPIWSLVHEFRFSLALPFVFMAARVWGLRPVLISTASLSAIGLFVARQGMVDPLMNYGGFLFVGDTIVASVALTCYLSIYFVAGMALAIMFEQVRARVSALPNWLLVFALLGCLILLSDWSEMIAGIGAAGIVLLIAACPGEFGILKLPITHWLGKISYSLYLIHVPILLALGHWLSGRAPIAVIFATAFVVSLAAAQLAQLCFEQPAGALARNLPRLRRLTKNPLEMEGATG